MLEIAGGGPGRKGGGEEGKPSPPPPFRPGPPWDFRRRFSFTARKFVSFKPHCSWVSRTLRTCPRPWITVSRFRNSFSEFGPGPLAVQWGLNDICIPRAVALKRFWHLSKNRLR